MTDDRKTGKPKVFEVTRPDGLIEEVQISPEGEVQVARWSPDSFEPTFVGTGEQANGDARGVLCALWHRWGAGEDIPVLEERVDAI